MNYIKQSIWALAAIAMVACSSDDDKETTDSLTPVVSKSTSFTASIESGNTTRTSLSTTSNPYPIWSSTDNINVYNKATQNNADFTISKGAGERAAEFSGTINVDKNEANNKFYAVYCANRTGANAPTLVEDAGTVKLSATIPASQSTTPGFHPELHFMTACTTGSTFKFKNAMSLIKVTINNNYENFRICRIRFTSNSTDDVIAGKFEAPIGNDGTLGSYSIIEESEDETGTETGTEPVNKTPKPSNEIVIDNGTSALGNGDYYIAILPCKFPYGFTLTFEDVSTDGNVKVYDRIKSATPDDKGCGFNIGASEIIDLGSYTAKACAKEAYVDLGLTNASGQKILWSIENVYDDNENSTVDNSYYAWGETSVKENQTKESECQNYSWYYTYSAGYGTPDEGSLTKRSYKYGIGQGAVLSSSAAKDRWSFPTSSKQSGHTGIVGVDDTSGGLVKYNSLEDYESNISDWSTGTRDYLPELETMDDAAYQKSKYRMRIASAADYQTLINAVGKTLNCGTAANSNKTLYKFINTTTKHYILLPIKGYRFKTSSTDNDNPKRVNTANDLWACYWTRDRADANADSYKAKSFRIIVSTKNDDLGSYIVDEERAAGLMLRGVMYR